MTVKDIVRRLTRRKPSIEAVKPEPVVLRPVGAPPAVSLDDFTVTVDTAASGGDRLVLRLSRERQPTLHMQVHIQQLMWLIDDPDQFAAAYAQRERWVDPYAEPAPELAEVTG